MKNINKILTVAAIIATLGSFSACKVVNAEELAVSETLTSATHETTVASETTTSENSTTAKETSESQNDTFTEALTKIESYSEKAFNITKKHNPEKKTSSVVETTTYTVISSTERTTRRIKRLPHYMPDTAATDLFNAVNDYREKCGVNRLEYDADLAALAYLRAKEQVEVRGHVRPDDTSFDTILSQYGYEEWSSVSENIAIGRDAVTEEMLNGWIDSPKGHGKNMINGKWVKSGMGHYRDENGIDYFVQLFTKN